MHRHRFDKQMRSGPRGDHGHGGGPRGEALREGMREAVREGMREGLRGRRGPGGRGRDEQELPSTEGLAAWFAGRLPDDWYVGAPEITVDRDEVLVVGVVPAPEAEGDAASVAAAEAGRISRFRETTRDERVAVAREAEHRWGRKVAWGAQAGGTRQVFTTLSVPVMTRLRQPERQVLDTLVASGVARSRSDALAWCVRLVADNADTWLSQLREAMEAVEKVRAQGPAGAATPEAPAS